MGWFDELKLFVEQLKVLKGTRTGGTHTQASFNLVMLTHPRWRVNGCHPCYWLCLTQLSQPNLYRTVLNAP
jgi:hypothetical protein